MPLHPRHPYRADCQRFALRDGATLDEVARAVAGPVASVDPPGLVAAYAFEAEPGGVEVVDVFADGTDDAQRDTALATLAEKLADHAELVERQTGAAVDLLALIEDGSRGLS